MSEALSSRVAYGALFAGVTKTIPLNENPLATVESLDTQPQLAMEQDRSTPEAFVALLESTLIMDEVNAASLIFDYALNSDIEYQELTIPEDELTKTTLIIEAQIDDFIQNAEVLKVITLIGSIEYVQLNAIFNPNNLLAFSKHLAEKSEKPLSIDTLDMIYRYRAVLKKLDEQGALLALVEDQKRYLEANKSRNGAKTWGGEIREYGCVNNGTIHYVDHRDFDGDHELKEHEAVTVEGTIVKLSNIRSESEYAERRAD